jgi:hypothetical protein
MAVTESWTDPDSLDRSTGDVLTEAIWDNTISNLAYLGGQTATGVIAPQRMGLPVDNSTGGSLAAGTLVYVSGYDAATGEPQITKADADSRQAEYILNAAIANGAAGVAYRGYTLGSLDTSGSSVGDPIYLSATAGSWTATALTGAAQLSQIVGVVVTSHASTGSIQFLLPGEMLKWGSGNLQSKSVAVAALADGTDGELITWSASAVAATVAVGTATHVLTSNGAGAAPTFQSAAGGPSQASQSALEAETDEDTYAAPDLIKYSPGVAKFYVKFDATAAVQGTAYNTTSVADNGVGDWTVTIATDFTGIDWACSCTIETGHTRSANIAGSGQAAGTLQVRSTDNNGTLADGYDMHVIGLGEQV